MRRSSWPCTDICCRRWTLVSRRDAQGSASIRPYLCQRPPTASAHCREAGDKMSRCIHGIFDRLLVRCILPGGAACAGLLLFAVHLLLRPTISRLRMTASSSRGENENTSRLGHGPSAKSNSTTETVNRHHQKSGSRLDRSSLGQSVQHVMAKGVHPTRDDVWVAAAVFGGVE